VLAEFMLGHVSRLDPNMYDKIYADPDFAEYQGHSPGSTQSPRTQRRFHALRWRSSWSGTKGWRRAWRPSTSFNHTRVPIRTP